MAIHVPKKIAVNSGGTLVNEVIYPYPCIVHAIHVAHATGGAAWHAIESAKTDARIEGHSFPYFFENGVYVCESDTVPTKTLHAGLDLFVVLVIEERTANV